MKTNHNLLPLFVTVILLVLLASCVSRRHTVRHNAVQTVSKHIESASDSVRTVSALLALTEGSAYAVRDERTTETDSLSLTWDTLGGRVVLTSAVRHRTATRHDATQSREASSSAALSSAESTSVAASAAADTSLVVTADTLSSAVSPVADAEPLKGGLKRAVAWLMGFVLFILFSIIVALLFKLLCRVVQFASRNE